MGLSARNQLPGIVEEVRLGTIMAHVIVRVGQSVIESVITRTSAEELKLKKGDSVRVVVKSTEVMIQKAAKLGELISGGLPCHLVFV
jgi:molybdopterin-binding protein